MIKSVGTLLGILGIVGVPLLVGGCTASAKLGEVTGGGGTGGDGGGGTSTSATTSGAGASDAGGGGTGGFLNTGGQTGSLDGRIFVHSLDTLYEIAPLTLQISVVGPFDCVLAEPSGSADSGMHDIAIDKDDRMFGIAEIAAQGGGPGESMVVVSIDPETGKCEKQLVVPPDVVDPNGAVQIRGLSFVPAGTLDPDEETLVALEIGGTYLRIDLVSESVSVVGNLDGGGGDSWLTKGADIVSIIDDKTYTTAKKVGETQDRVVIVDPVTGAITEGLAPTSIVTIGGLAYWGGTLYAFTGDGDVYSIDPKTGVETGIALNGAIPGLQFHGAGVATDAPLTVPK